MQYEHLLATFLIQGVKTNWQYRQIRGIFAQAWGKYCWYDGWRNWQDRNEIKGNHLFYGASNI